MNTEVWPPKGGNEVVYTHNSPFPLTTGLVLRSRFRNKLEEVAEKVFVGFLFSLSLSHFHRKGASVSSPLRRQYCSEHLWILICPSLNLFHGREWGYVWDDDWKYLHLKCVYSMTQTHRVVFRFCSQLLSVTRPVIQKAFYGVIVRNWPPNQGLVFQVPFLLLALAFRSMSRCFAQDSQ